MRWWSFWWRESRDVLKRLEVGWENRVGVEEDFGTGLRCWSEGGWMGQRCTTWALAVWRGRDWGSMGSILFLSEMGLDYWVVWVNDSARLNTCRALMCEDNVYQGMSETASSRTVEWPYGFRSTSLE